mgnify:CR=1 FL=1
MTLLDDGPASVSPKQAASMLDADARVNIWEGSVSSGKTIASLLAWLHWVATDAPREGRLAMIGRTKDTLYRNVLSVMLDLLPAGDGSITYTRGANTAVIFGREVDVLGASDATAETRIRGLTLAGAYVDEATLLPGDGFWSQLMNRLRVPGARCFATTNPDGPMHWFKVQVIDRAQELGYRTWHFTLDDNPGLTAEYRQQIARENVGLWYQRNILGLWVLADGVIWDMWDEDRHVAPPPTREDGSMVVDGCALAIDYGTAGVFAAELLAATRNRLHVVAEWRWDAKAERRQLTDAEYSQRLRLWLLDQAALCPAAHPDALEFVFVDPSATSFIAQLHRDRWQRVRLADNDVADGIRETAMLLGAGLLQVAPSCTGLRREIPGYVWDPKAAQHGEDRPVKANDHSCDALRYGVRGTRRWWRHWLTDTLPAAA